LWLAGRDVEASSIAGWQGPVVYIRASGFPSGRLRAAVVSVWRLLGAFRSAWQTMRTMRPEVLLCMGSYASVAPCLAARCFGIPVVLHEANAVPGRAISFLARFARRVAVGFEEALAYFPPGKAVVTGFPLRRGFSPSASCSEGKTLSLLVMGGSQGARVLNERMPAVAAALQTQHAVRVVHLAGRQAADAVDAAYRDHQVSARVFAFSSDMATLYAQADLVVARAGAATCTELAVCGLPCILVPLPHAPRNHQMRNAEALARLGGAVIMPEAEFSTGTMVQRIETLISRPEVLKTMRAAQQRAVPADGTRRLADLVEGVGTQA